MYILTGNIVQNSCGAAFVLLCRIPSNSCTKPMACLLSCFNSKQDSRELMTQLYEYTTFMTHQREDKEHSLNLFVLYFQMEFMIISNFE